MTQRDARLFSLPRWDAKGEGLLNTATAQQAGYLYLSSWLARAEELWARHSRGGLTLTEQLDYHGKLTAQLPAVAARLVYAVSGTLPAAAFLPDPHGIVGHELYWACE